jgi:glycosyltransferase involved in cell wall biosynthesis
MKQKQEIIWYCHPTAGSPEEGMSYRPYYLAKNWQQTGHQTYVISSSFHHLLHHPKTQKKPLEVFSQSGVNYIRLKTPRYKANGFKRILNMLVYSLRFVLHSKSILARTGKPTAIIVSSTHPFHYFPLYRLAKKLKVPLIFEVRDLWPSSLIEILKLKPWHPLVWTLGLIEKHAYRHADQVVSLLEFAKPYMESKGLNPEKFQYIPNGTEVTDINSKISLPTQHQKLLQHLKTHDKFIIAYTGAMGPPNALEHLLAAMNILNTTHPHIHCLLLGHGQNLAALKDYCYKHQMQNVDFLPRISKDLIPLFLSQVDSVYLGWQDTSLYQYGVSPNKIFDYMLAAKPIIESGGSPISLVTQAQCGIQTAAAAPELIAQSIIKLSQLSKVELETLGANAKAFVLKHHTYPVLAKQFLTVLSLHDSLRKPLTTIQT